MTVITNDCVGGRCYQVLKNRFNNPFAWCRIKYDDFKYILLHYYDIDYSTYQLEQNNKEDGRITYNVVLENNITLWFRHYVEDAQYLLPTQMSNNAQLDLRYYNMKLYVRQKFDERAKRILKDDKLVFILNQKSNYDEYAITNEHCRDFVMLKTDYIKILLLSDKDLYDSLKTYNSNNCIILLKNTENTALIAISLITKYKDVFK